jgi:hypothetical protein
VRALGVGERLAEPVRQEMGHPVAAPRCQGFRRPDDPPTIWMRAPVLRAERPGDPGDVDLDPVDEVMQLPKREAVRVVVHDRHVALDMPHEHLAGIERDAGGAKVGEEPGAVAVEIAPPVVDLVPLAIPPVVLAEESRTGCSFDVPRLRCGKEPPLALAAPEGHEFQESRARPGCVWTGTDRRAFLDFAVADWRW